MAEKTDWEQEWSRDVAVPKAFNALTELLGATVVTNSEKVEEILTSLYDSGQAHGYEYDLSGVSAGPEGPANRERKKK